MSFAFTDILRRTVGRVAPTRRPRWRAVSVGTKLGALILVCMSMAMAVAAAIFVHQAHVEADAKARQLARGAFDDIAASVRTELEQTFAAVTQTESAIVTLWSHDVRDRRTADVLLKGVLEDDRDLFGVWSVWKPNAFDGRDAAFVDAPGSDATGRYLTYWHQNGMELTQDHARDTASEPRFVTPLETEKSFLSEPYYIRSNDERIAAASFSEPIFVDDKVVGAIGVDVALRALVDRVEAVVAPRGAKAMIVSHAGVLVAAAGDQVTETSLAAARPDMADELARAQKLGGTTRVAQMPTGAILVGWAPLSTIDNPWYVRVELPVGAFAVDAAAQQKPTIAIVLAILAAMMVAVLVALRLLVTRPLERVESFVGRLGDSAATGDCPGTRRDDEIGAIAKALTAFGSSEQEVRRLRRADLEREAHFATARRAELQALADHLARTVQSVAGAVDAASRKIMRRAETMTAAAVASADRTKAIADASSAADTSVGSVDTATAALREAIARIAIEMRDARAIASDAATRARASGTVTEALSSRADRIGEIVALISSIAQRTNMLALNATIEAARAGESGRGFAIVAQEVKALASQTTAATVDIGRQIEAMQTTAAEAADALSAIGGHVAAIDVISSSVAGAVSEQGEATDVIGRSVETAVEASRRVGRAIGEVDRATSQAGDAAADMLVDIAELSEQVGRLDDEVRAAIERIRAA